MARAKPALSAAPLPLVGELQQQGHPVPLARRPLPQQLARPVGGAVVHDDHLRIQIDRRHAVEQFDDRRPLVIDGDHNGKTHRQECRTPRIIQNWVGSGRANEETVCCARGDIEDRIKELLHGLQVNHRAAVRRRRVATSTHRAATVDQQAPQVAVAAFADVSESPAAAARVFARRQPDPDRKLARPRPNAWM